MSLWKGESAPTSKIGFFKRRNLYEGRYNSPFVKEELVPTITIEDAQARLPALIATLKPGEELLIVDGGQPVARLVGESLTSRKARKPGSAIGELSILKEDDE